jgi:hypothetical protein
MASENGIPLEPTFVSELRNESVGGKIYSHMRALFHLAVSISPLYMLFPTQFGSATIGREQMMGVS